MSGADVVQLREMLGLTKDECARVLGVSPSTFAGWEEEGPHGLGRSVLSGLHSAVFDAPDVLTPAWDARVMSIGRCLRLGFSAFVSRGLCAAAGGLS